MSSEDSGSAGPLEPLEIAAGMVLEPAHPPRSPRAPRTGPSARSVLEKIILDQLAEGRSSVSFSGGRDSSLILAMACHVARREGLPQPVAVTMRHGSARSQEQEFQEQVIVHLGVQDWVTVDVRDSMDLLGVEATSCLLQTGIQAPPNAYLHIPLVRAAPVGTLLTGVGGDEMLGSTGGRVAQLLTRRQGLIPRDAVVLAYALAPSPLRRLRGRRRPFPWSPWLRPEARKAVIARYAANSSQVRWRWDTAVRRFARSRYRRLATASLEVIAMPSGRRIASPLFDASFIQAHAREWGAAGPRTRTEAMRRLVGDLLPEEVLARRTKAEFGGVIWGPHFRRFVTGAAKEYLSPAVRELVDFAQLLEDWRHAAPSYQSMLLAQHAWLGAQQFSQRDPR